jgi:hypothetical protein
VAGVLKEQQYIRATLLENEFINETTNFYLLGVPYETKNYEIGGLALGTENYFSFDELEKQVKDALNNKIRYDQQLSGSTLEARLLDWSRNYFWNENQDSALALGKITKYALLHHTEAATGHELLYSSVYGIKIDDTILKDKGGYSKSDNYWWDSDGVMYYNTGSGFYLPVKTIDPFNAETSVKYDAYNLFPDTSTDALGNTVTAEIDYRTLSPCKLTDPNDNCAEVLSDPMGMVIVTSIYGREETTDKGDDTLSTYTEVSSPSIDDIIKYPEKYLQNATAYFYYDLEAWKTRSEPPYFVNLLRETHVKDLTGNEKTRIQIQLGYSDGYGRTGQGIFKRYRRKFDLK